MDDPDLDAAEVQCRLRTLVNLAGAVGTSTIMLPCGRQGTEPRTELSRDIATVARTLTASRRFRQRSGARATRGGPATHGGCAPTWTAQKCCTRRSRDAPVGAVLDLSDVVASGGDEVDAVRRLAIASATCSCVTPSWAISIAASGAARWISPPPSRRWPGPLPGPLQPWLEKLTTSSDEDRPTEAGRAGRYITSLLQGFAPAACDVDSRP